MAVLEPIALFTVMKSSVSCIIKLKLHLNFWQATKFI